MIPKFNEYKERFQMESKHTIEPGLGAITHALEKVRNPQQNLKFIHVAGTNGKGSTISMMNSMFQAHGVKTACFYSPCFMDVHDQIQLNGENISPQQLDFVFLQAKEAGLSGLLTDFELLTVLAFMAFEQFQPHIVLLEAGMGGRFDSTNVITPVISVIPSIALEHEQFLGNTIVQVASHKAGIIKEGIPVVVGPLEESAEQVIFKETLKKNSPLWKLNQDFSFAHGMYKNSVGHQISHLTVPLPGPHQLDNAALAIRSVIYVIENLNININEELLRRGLKEAFIPGRFEKITDTLYFDGAHNPASARALVNTVKEVFPNTPIHFYVGMIKGKDAKTVLRIFEEISSNFTFVDFEDERSMPSSALSKISESPYSEVTKEPLESILKTSSKTHVTIVTGSLYLLSEMRLRALQLFGIF
ncbi:bifunctional folylpolyglutamate synthase/dihydrofolate synthase [Paenisporosarcina antarctica]|uniref:tetrahydrofolate synthase n=1 Tax=Paenisporosarcina antarctica TaxID=417367 RepID=A0A4V1AMX1_9BACL|nr:folylpolyglutamate synthase/dihydrofolate synthase family protein [Paenisporosarcina antarctica]QBP40755.1 bifunctional folylpolyglutamate synthase/dihydrofolate synthase [Paenisporosarcina antarctica]